MSDQRIFTWQYSPYLRSWETLGQWGRRGGRRGSLGRRPGSLNIFSFTKKKEECKLKLDFIWTGDGMSYSRFSGNLCTFCGWRVTFVRVGCGAVVHETIHVFKRDLGRGSQHLGEGSGIFEYLCIFHFCLQVVVRLKTHLGPWANERIARPIVFIWTILPTKAWVQFWGSSRFTRNMLKERPDFCWAKRSI